MTHIFCQRIFVVSMICALISFGANEYSICSQSYDTPVVKISPVAQTQLDKTEAAYKALTFYASDIKMETSGLPDNLQLSAKVAWQKPNNLRVEADNGAGTSLYVSDGAKLWMTMARAPRQYLEKTVSSTRSLMPSVLTETSIDKTTLGMFLLGKDPLRQFGSALQSVEATKVKVGGKIALDRVALVMKLLRRKDEGTATFVIDGKTNLLRSVKISKTVGGAPVTIAETYNNRRLKADANDNFEYSIPVGDVRVTKFETLPYDPRLVAGAQPFRIDVNDIDGKLVNLDEYKGKVVILDFWATWCPPCKVDAPRLAALHNKYKDQGLEIIGVNMDYDMLNLRPFAEHYGMTWRQTYDGKGWDNAISNRFGVASIPFTLVIGRDGKIAEPIIAQEVSNLREKAVIKALAAKAE